MSPEPVSTPAWILRQWAGRQTVMRLRALANGMPYRSEAKRAELIDWLVKYDPARIVRARDEELAKICQAPTRQQQYGTSWASTTWSCRNRATKTYTGGSHKNLPVCGTHFNMLVRDDGPDQTPNQQGGR